MNKAALADWLTSYYRQQKIEGKRRSAHDEIHMLKVAEEGGRYVEKVGGSRWAQQMTVLAGLLHDLVRAPKEVNRALKTSDGFVTAEILRYLRMKKINNQMLEDVVLSLLEADSQLRKLAAYLALWSEEEISLIAWVIERNEGKVGEIVESAKRAGGEEEIISLGLLYGDKGKEGIGPRIVYRRAAWVAGERYFKGDLRSFKKKLEEVLTHPISNEEGMAAAFVFESLRRILLAKRLEDFPEGPLWEEVKQSRKFEIEVFSGVAGWLMKKWEITDWQTLVEIGKQAQYPLYDIEHSTLKRKVETLPLPLSKLEALYLILAIAYQEFDQEKSAYYHHLLRTPSYKKLVKEGQDYRPWLRKVKGWME